MYLKFSSIARFGWILAPVVNKAARSLPNIRLTTNSGVVKIAGRLKTEANACERFNIISSFL